MGTSNTYFVRAYEWATQDIDAAKDELAQLGLRIRVMLAREDVAAANDAADDAFQRHGWKWKRYEEFAQEQSSSEVEDLPLMEAYISGLSAAEIICEMPIQHVRQLARDHGISTKGLRKKRDIAQSISDDVGAMPKITALVKSIRDAKISCLQADRDAVRQGMGEALVHRVFGKLYALRRLADVFDPDIARFVKGAALSTIRDGRTPPECLKEDGVARPLSYWKARSEPPCLRLFCRCILVPVVAGDPRNNNRQ